MAWSFGSTALSWSSDPTTMAMLAAACKILVRPGVCVVERNTFCDRQPRPPLILWDSLSQTILPPDYSGPRPFQLQFMITCFTEQQNYIR